jgi:hypothetical protein
VGGLSNDPSGFVQEGVDEDGVPAA